MNQDETHLKQHLQQLNYGVCIASVKRLGTVATLQDKPFSVGSICDFSPQ